MVYVVFYSLQWNSKPSMSDDLSHLPWIAHCIVKVGKQCVSTSGVVPQ